MIPELRANPRVSKNKETRASTRFILSSYLLNVRNRDPDRSAMSSISASTLKNYLPALLAAIALQEAEAHGIGLGEALQAKAL